MPRKSRRGYGRFARYYDAIYDEVVKYEKDVDFLEAAFRKFRRAPRTILDLGCGTGNHDLPLARRGYVVTGIDRSPEMLALARRKAASAGARVAFVRADMQSFRLEDTFDAAICMFGAIGYLLGPRDIVRCLRKRSPTPGTDRPVRLRILAKIRCKTGAASKLDASVEVES